MRQNDIFADLRLSTLKDYQYWLSNSKSYLTWKHFNINLRDNKPWSGIAMISTLNQSSYHLLKASLSTDLIIEFNLQIA